MKDVEELVEKSEVNDTVTSSARLLLRSYIFPVQITILSPLDGAVIATMNANDWLKQTDDVISDAINDTHNIWFDAASEIYLKFLKKALREDF